MIRYSKRAMKAYAHLYRPYNDFDVYVEDSSYVGVYERIINRALKGAARVSRVIPLGPKEEVLEAASNDNDDGRKKLYIVDSDLDLISKPRIQRISNVHRLSVYSLENLVFEKDAVDQYLIFSQPSKESTRCIQAYDYASYEEGLERSLGLYIAALGAAWRLNLRGPAFAMDPRGLSEVLNGHSVGPDKRALRRKTASVIRAIKSQSSDAEYKQSKRVVLDIIKKRNFSANRYVPGKKFLIAYLNGMVVKSGGDAHRQQAIISYLAERCTLSFDKKLARRLRSLARP